MNCGFSEELLYQYYEGALSGKESAEVKKHLDSCGECRETLKYIDISESETRKFKRKYAEKPLKNESFKKILVNCDKNVTFFSVLMRYAADRKISASFSLVILLVFAAPFYPAAKENIAFSIPSSLPRGEECFISYTEGRLLENVSLSVVAAEGEYTYPLITESDVLMRPNAKKKLAIPDNMPSQAMLRISVNNEKSVSTLKIRDRIVLIETDGVNPENADFIVAINDVRAIGKNFVFHADGKEQVFTADSEGRITVPRSILSGDFSVAHDTIKADFNYTAEQIREPAKIAAKKSDSEAAEGLAYFSGNTNQPETKIKKVIYPYSDKIEYETIGFTYTDESVRDSIRKISAVTALVYSIFLGVAAWKKQKSEKEKLRKLIHS